MINRLSPGRGVVVDTTGHGCGPGVGTGKGETRTQASDSLEPKPDVFAQSQGAGQHLLCASKVSIASPMCTCKPFIAETLLSSSD
eukprot:2034126-Amphidinium_carterae.1